MTLSDMLKKKHTLRLTGLIFVKLSRLCRSLTCWEFQVSLDVVKSFFYGCISAVSSHLPPLVFPSLSLTSPTTSLGPVSVYHSRN